MVTADYSQEWRLKRYHYSIYLMPLFARMCSLSQATKILSDTLKEQGVVDEAIKVLDKFPEAPHKFIYIVQNDIIQERAFMKSIESFIYLIEGIIGSTETKST